MTKQEAEWLTAQMKKEGWPEVLVEPAMGDGYAVAYRRLPDESYRRARRLSPSIQTRYDQEAEAERSGPRPPQ